MRYRTGKRTPINQPMTSSQKEAFEKMQYYEETWMTEQTEITRILWLSRHSPEDDQIAELKEIFGKIEIIQKSETVNDAYEVRGIMEKARAKEIVAVLPLSILAGLLRIGIQPIRAVMKREVISDEEVNFHHDFFERVIKIEVETVIIKNHSR